MITSAYFDWVRSSSSSIGGLVMPSAVDTDSDTSQLSQQLGAWQRARTTSAVHPADLYLAILPSGRAGGLAPPTGTFRTCGTAAVTRCTPLHARGTGLARLPGNLACCAAVSPRPQQCPAPHCTARPVRAVRRAASPEGSAPCASE